MGEPKSLCMYGSEVPDTKATGRKNGLPIIFSTFSLSTD